MLDRGRDTDTGLWKLRSSSVGNTSSLSSTRVPSMANFEDSALFGRASDLTFHKDSDAVLFTGLKKLSHHAYAEKGSQLGIPTCLTVRYFKAGGKVNGVLSSSLFIRCRDKYTSEQVVGLFSFTI
jgi:hypothetical protein